MRERINTVIPIINAQPDLQIHLLDEDGDSTLELSVKPIYIREKIVKKKVSTPTEMLFRPMLDVMKTIGSIDSFPKEKKPTPDLVPISIIISNDGTKGAEKIYIFLEFPPDCNLYSEQDVKGGISRDMLVRDYSGLFVSNKHEAKAFLDDLGNDLEFSDFSPIYVRFPEKEQDIEIFITIIQSGWPKKELRAIIHVHPESQEIEKIQG